MPEESMQNQDSSGTKDESDQGGREEQTHPKKGNANKLILWVIIIILVIFGIWYSRTKKESDITETPEQPIKVGVIAPLTGKTAIYGQRIKNGLELALEEINQDTEKAREIEIIYEDSAGDLDQAVSAARKLIDINKIKILISCLSSETLALAPIAEEHQVILFAPAASSGDITTAGDYTFRNRETGVIHGQKIAELAHSLGHKRIAILFVNADNGITYKDGFINKYDELDGEIIYEESYVKGENDYRTQVSKIKSANPDALYLPGYGKDIAQILKQAGELGIDHPIFSSPGIEVPELFEIASSTAEGVIYSVPAYDPEDSKVKDFTDAYKQKYGEESEFISANSYDALYLLNSAFETCEDDSSCIKDKLYKIKDYPGVGGTTTFDQNGDVVKPVILKTIKSGQFVPYEE